MNFLSTRGGAPALSFREVLFSGLASDGGLYVPEEFPRFEPDELEAMADEPYAATAARFLAKFAAPEFSVETLLRIASEAYSVFDEPEVVKLRSIAPEQWLLELFHGPTLAFKDLAMQMLAALYSEALVPPRRKTIIGATSGDTGGAAIGAFAGNAMVDIVILHPKGRISEVQRRIMTTVSARNVTNIAVEGSFDDCQQIIKQLFVDPELTRRRDLGGINSINLVRLLLQAAYYGAATARLGDGACPPTFVVPTGNFGDAFAGFIAKRMGVPLKGLAVAVNDNDIVHRAIALGDYSRRQVRATSSPSMDIQVASNFERLLFLTMGRDTRRLNEALQTFSTSGALTIANDVQTLIREAFLSEAANEREVGQVISNFSRNHGLLVDPHTAVGLVVSEKLRCSGALKGVSVVLATAHPAKFPEAVSAATGINPELPSRFMDLMSRQERYQIANADYLHVRQLILDATPEAG